MNNFSTAQNSKSVYHRTERKKSNLAFAFFCLDKSRATDMEIFYAFCRLMDDIADEDGVEVETKKKLLGQWKDEIDAVYRGGGNLSPLGEEMKEMILRRQIPKEYIVAIIDGVLRDTSDAPFETFEDVRRYCYGVASAVGLASIYIFGFKNPVTKQFAEALGYALQFTNILRDVVDDMRSHGRVYIPQSELRAFNVSREDLRDPSKNPACKKLFALIYFRAKHFFNKARRLLCAQDRRNLAPALIMWAIYEDILEKLKALDFEIPAKPLKISKPRKIFLALDAIRRSKKSVEEESYGRVAVVGAGVAGVAAAVNLCARGFDVSVYESRNFGGGRAAAIEWNGARLDNGSHALMGCYENFFKLTKMLGVEAGEFFAPVRSMDFISKSGSQTVDMPAPDASPMRKIFGFLGYLKLSALGSFANVRLLFKIKMGAAKVVKGETAAAYLSRMGIGKAAVETFWLPFCVSALNTSLEDASAKVMCETLQKSILKSAEAGRLYLPQKPIADALFPAASLLLEACGGSINLNDTVEKIEFENGTAKAVESQKKGRQEFDWVVCAANPPACKKLLEQSGQAGNAIGSLRENPIENVYFTTRKKLLNSEYACLVGSPLHWIFDHTKKSDKGSESFLYGVTISAGELKNSKSEICGFIKEKLSEIFGEFEIDDILPMNFKTATLSADCQTEAMRPKADALGLSNFRIVGDWTFTGLPATIESAAKSGLELELK